MPEMPGVAAPIILLAFDRPHLLARVLETLAAQQPAIDPRRLHLFLDGHFCPYRDQAVADPAAVDATALVFQRAFPEGQVHRAATNLGVAFNYDRAERFAFEELQAPVAYFLEDDLELSPRYLAALDQLAALALGQERIACVAAYGDHLLPVAEQVRRRRELMALEHLWGFALTRRHWLERRPIIDPYLDLLRGANYRDRPDQRVLEYFWGLGIGVRGTSQDAAKTAACLLLGRVQLRCAAVLARYVGDEGLHMSKQLFINLGYADTQLFPADMPLEDFILPSDAELDALLAARRAEAEGLRGKVPKAPRAWPPQPLPLDAAGVVTLFYRGVLGREPDETGFANNLAALQRGDCSPAQLLASFIASAEFRDKFTKT